MEFFNDVGGDPLKPTLFELVAQEQLRDLLQPALKYVLSVRLEAPTSPNDFGRAENLALIRRYSHSGILAICYDW